MQYSIPLQKAELRTMIDFISKELDNGVNFKDSIDYQISAKLKGSTGGWKNGHPVMTIGHNDFGRSSDKETFLTHVIGREYKGRVWQEVEVNARLGNWMFCEYSHIHNDPDIGKFISDDPKHHTDALLCHELAHAAQRFAQKNGDYQFGSDFKAHGKVFQSIYRLLRDELVNPFIPKKKAIVKPVQAPYLQPMAEPAAKPAKSFGAVAQCWGHFDEMLERGVINRKEMIRIGEKKGLSKGTLGTQYSKWRKERGLIVE